MSSLSQHIEDAINKSGPLEALGLILLLIGTLGLLFAGLAWLYGYGIIYSVNYLFAVSLPETHKAYLLMGALVLMSKGILRGKSE